MACSVQLSSQKISCNFWKVIPATKPKNVTAVKSVINSGAPATKISDPPQPVVRRTGNYKPCIWDNYFLQSLKSDYTEERCASIGDSELKEAVKFMFKNAVEALDQLELTDHLQRLGLAYHFRQEISHTLNKIYTTNYDKYWEENNLYAATLRYRLLREHGYQISAG